MEKLIDCLSAKLKDAFLKAGYDPEFGSVRVSDRPDLCEFQCNGAMAAAKQYRKAPFMIASDVEKNLLESGDLPFTVSVVKPGFINLDVTPAFLASYVSEMAADPDLGISKMQKPEKIVIDYGGPNVAKPLHVGHLRAAVIGESIKRILREAGNDVLGDVHLGDWGLQMGLIITEMKHRSPDLPYFGDEPEEGWPDEAPFTISELEEIYPCASARSKEDEEYRKEALAATQLLQEGRPGYRALWQKIMEISVADLKKNYDRLDVHFDLWKAESDVQQYIPSMVEKMKADGVAREDQGALVVDVAEDTDKIEIPPCIILKSDGASLYSTTDLATIFEREMLFDPDRIIYVVDKRQSMHFTQVFRTARKAGIAKPDTELIHVGFGTMNGKDGKPFKTRDGGVMRLESLLNEIAEEMAVKIRDNRNVRAEDADRTAEMVALSAIKYGDLWNQAARDYVFDVEKFTSFEGNTGPYILYTIVRIRSILSKADPDDLAAASECGIKDPETEEEKALLLSAAAFHSAFAEACEELAPHKLCAYVYQTANEFNRFYHETKILGEENRETRRAYLALLMVTRRIMEKCISLLGFEAPEQM